MTGGRYLNIDEDAPEDYEGRLVHVDGAEYVVGRLVGQGGERFVHSLTNVRTGLSLHLLKIPRDQELAGQAPEQLGGRSIPAWLKKAAQELEHVSYEKVPQLVYGHGGAFEITEAAAPDPEYGALFERVKEAFKERNWAQCEALCTRVLACAPEHVVALHGLAVARARQGDHESAFSLERRAVALEPNIRLYWGQLMESSSALGLVHNAVDAFSHLRSKWPDDGTWNKLAITLYLDMGRPDVAAGLLPARADRQLARQVHSEVRARIRARRRMEAARRAAEAGRAARAAKRLSKAYRRYPKDIDVAFNHGISLLRTGRCAEANDVLLGICQFVPLEWRAQCFGSIGFALALDGKDARAAQTFELVMAQLDSEATEETDREDRDDHGLPQLDDYEHAIWDLPMWPVWWRGDSVVGERSDRAAVVVDELLRRLQAQDEAPRALHRLSLAYERGLPAFLGLADSAG